MYPKDAYYGGELVMGCDIHVHHEVKNKEGHWQSSDEWTEKKEDYDDTHYWETKKSNYVCRDYNLFGAIAGNLRRDIPESLPINGFPSNASFEVKREYEIWEHDGHSHCVRTIAELEDLVNILPVFLLHDTVYVVPSIVELIEQFKLADIPSDQQRLVYWFDN